MNPLRSLTLLFILLLIAPISNDQAQTRRSSIKKDIQITWLGHAAFEIV